MAATLLDGKATLATIKDELRVRVKALADAGRTPGLGTILVGDDPGSRAYVNGKHRDCADVGIISIRRDLPADATQADVEAAVDELNADPACTGYLVQLPLPKGLDEQRVLDAPRGIVELLRRFGVPLAGAEVVVVGRGTTVGRPLGLLLTRRSENATVTTCHTGTRDLAAHLRTADIVVAAAGVAGLVTADVIRPGATVLDVGITRVVDADGKARLVGDVHPDVAAVAGFLAPMPGGVGPMTRAMLLTNVVELAEQVAGAAAG